MSIQSASSQQRRPFVVSSGGRLHGVRAAAPFRGWVAGGGVVDRLTPM